jgi:hypothetical protein
VDLLGVGGGYLLILMIEASHTIHTHSRSTSYIYKVFQHLELCLVAIRIPPHPDNFLLGPESGSPLPSCRRWVSVSSYD